MHFRKATSGDLEGIKTLYREVAKLSGGIARLEDEVTDEYVAGFLEKSLKQGLIFVGEDKSRLIAEIHAYKSGLQIFDHTIGSLTLAVHPDFQGMKLGYKIFKLLLDDIIDNRQDILKIELFVRETNLRAQRLYESLGFQVEGRMANRIKKHDDTFEADIPMGWQNPNFKLKKV